MGFEQSTILPMYFSQLSRCWALLWSWAAFPKNIWPPHFFLVRVRVQARETLEDLCLTEAEPCPGPHPRGPRGQHAHGHPLRPPRRCAEGFAQRSLLSLPRLLFKVGDLPRVLNRSRPPRVAAMPPPPRNSWPHALTDLYIFNAL